MENSVWTRPNPRRALRYLWASITSVAGIIDIAGMVVVGFFVSLIPGVDDLAKQSWFKPTVGIVGVTFLAYYTALRASAEIEGYRAAEERRGTEFRRQYFSMLGDVRNLMDQVREIERTRKVIVTRKITPRWQEFEFANVILDEIDATSDKIKSILARSHSSTETDACLARLRTLSEEAAKRLQQVYEGHWKITRDGEPKPT